ncbi:MAG: helix-turn-helix transcriptional regulator [Dehalococcoidia bacterium]
MERPGRTELDRLTARQREVLALIARGRTNGEIAGQLGITLDGVKWHVRGILSELGVESREEAAEVWRVRPRLPMPGWFAWPGWRIAGIAGGVAVAVLAVVVVVLALRGGEPKEFEAAAGAPTMSPTVVPTPSAQLAFRECARYENWSLPSTDDLRDRILLDERLLGADGRPPPAHHAYYLEYFWYNPVPSANSALIEPSVFHGVSTRGPTATVEDFCRYPDDLAFGFEHTQSLWLREHEVVRLTATPEELVAVVRPDRGVFRIVQFDASVTGTESSKGVAVTRPFRVVRFVQENGMPLHEDGGRLRSEHDPDGTFRVARVADQGVAVSMRSPDGGIVVQLFGSLPPGGTRARVWDATGSEFVVDLEPGDTDWDPLAELALRAGMWWVKFEGPMGDSGLVLIRKGLPLP